MIEEFLPYVGRGLVDFVVVAKPAVQNIDEMHRVDTAVSEAKEDLAQLRGVPTDKLDPILYVHEHYKEKGPWNALRKRLGAVASRLGRLESVHLSIEESQTIEDENRLDAFAGGAWEDLGPHVVSLALDIQSAVNKP